MTVELAGGSVELVPAWGEDGSITALEARVSVDAIVLEALPGLELGLGRGAGGDRARARRRAGGWIYNILSKSVSLAWTFSAWGVGWSAATRSAGHAMSSPWSSMLPELEISVTAGAELLNILRVCRGAGLEWHV